MNKPEPTSDGFRRIDAIKATLAKIRLRLKAHKAVDLHQINSMSEEVLSALQSEKKQLDKEEFKVLQQKGAYVQANLEKMREVIWEEDRKYLHRIYQIIFSIDELTYAIPFYDPHLIEEKLEELTKNLSEVVQEMIYFSPRVEEKIKLAYEKLQHIHFLSYHPISQELISFSYFPNFSQYIQKIAILYRKGEEVQANALFAELSQKQKKEIRAIAKIKKKFSELTPKEKGETLEKFLENIDALFLTAKKIFYGEENTVEEQLKQLDTRVKKYIEQYLWSMQDDKEPLHHKATLGIIQYVDELLLGC